MPEQPSRVRVPKFHARQRGVLCGLLRVPVLQGGELMATLLELEADLAGVRKDQEKTDVMSVWYALQELADYYEGLIEDLLEIQEQENE